jgi:hypothetical protein
MAPIPMSYSTMVSYDINDVISYDLHQGFDQCLDKVL